MDVLASVRQPSTFRMLIWPEASNAQNSIAAVSADGSTGCVLILRLNSSCNRSMAFVVRALRHWPGGRRVTRFDLFARRSVDHIVVVGGDLLMQALGCMGEEIAVLVHRAPLYRDVVPNGGDRALQPGAAVDD